MHTAVALRALSEDIANTHDALIRIGHPTVSRRIRRRLSQDRPVRGAKWLYHVIYPQLNLEYVVYREAKTERLRMAVLS
jgi:hypothetical protein